MSTHNFPSVPFLYYTIPLPIAPLVIGCVLCCNTVQLSAGEATFVDGSTAYRLTVGEIRSSLLRQLLGPPATDAGHAVDRHGRALRILDSLGYFHPELDFHGLVADHRRDPDSGADMLAFLAEDLDQDIGKGVHNPTLFVESRSDLQEAGHLEHAFYLVQTAYELPDAG